jgi:hypothetical protein
VFVKSDLAESEIPLDNVIGWSCQDVSVLMDDIAASLRPMQSLLFAAPSEASAHCPLEPIRAALDHSSWA